MSNCNANMIQFQIIKKNIFGQKNHGTQIDSNVFGLIINIVTHKILNTSQMQTNFMSYNYNNKQAI